MNTTNATSLDTVISERNELLAALRLLVGNNALTSLCHHEGQDILGRVKGTWGYDAEYRARKVLAKYDSPVNPTQATDFMPTVGTPNVFRMLDGRPVIKTAYGWELQTVDGKSIRQLDKFECEFIGQAIKAAILLRGTS